MVMIRHIALALLLALLPGMALADPYTIPDPTLSTGGGGGGGPVTSGGITSALGYVPVAPSGSSANTTALAIGGIAAAPTLAARFAQRIDVRADFGAVGDGATDDSAAIAAAFASANSRAAAGTQIQVYFPGGRYVVKSTTLPTFTNGIQVRGDGRMTSEIIVDTAYTGAAVLSWLNTWLGTGIASTGAGVSDIAIVGNVTSANVQNAIVLYDHVDIFRLENVDVYNMTGRALYAGVELTQPTAYTRESHFSNFRAYADGQSGTPTVEFTSQCTAGVSACVDTEATNEIDIDNFDIYSPGGAGFLLRNENASGTVRGIRIAHVRVEGLQNFAGTGNLFQIGSPTQTGGLKSVSITDSELISEYTGYYAFQTTAGALSGAPTAIFAHGLMLGLASNAGGGVNINACTSCAIHLDGINSLGTNVTIASSAMIASPLVIEANGAELLWTWTVDASVSPFLRTSNGNYGVPRTTSNYISAQQPNAGTSGGNVRGPNATDWQQMRFGANQVASGAYSTIAGGQDNTANQGGSTVGGGNQNNNGSFNGTISGGADNFISGSYGTIPGGTQGSNLNNYGAFAYSSGMFSAAGDAEWMVALLRVATADTTAHRILADGTGVATSGNTLVPAFNSVWAVDLTCLYLDTVSLATASWSWQGVSLFMAASAATTVVAAPAATAGQVHGTPGATAPVIAADTINGGMSISFTAPNADASRVVCRANIVT